MTTTPEQEQLLRLSRGWMEVGEELLRRDPTYFEAVLKLAQAWLSRLEVVQRQEQEKG